MFDVAHQQVSEGFYLRKASGSCPSDMRRAEDLLVAFAGPSSFFSPRICEQTCIHHYQVEQESFQFVFIIKETEKKQKKKKNNNYSTAQQYTVDLTHPLSHLVNSFMYYSLPISIVVFPFNVSCCSISDSERPKKKKKSCRY